MVYCNLWYFLFVFNVQTSPHILYEVVQQSEDFEHSKQESTEIFATDGKLTTKQGAPDSHHLQPPPAQPLSPQLV